MTTATSLVRQAYSAFNQRNIDAALALMTEDITWPKASEGGRVTGKEAIRAYWTRQWAGFDPHVEPLSLTEEPQNHARNQVHVQIRVHARQLVKSLHGQTLSDTQVVHIFTIRHGLIAAMHLGGQADAAPGPSSAFAHR